MLNIDRVINIFGIARRYCKEHHNMDSLYISHFLNDYLHKEGLETSLEYMLYDFDRNIFTYQILIGDDTFSYALEDIDNIKDLNLKNIENIQQIQ
jgi:hypothetical protein